MTITWNEKADAKLLAGIIAISPSSIDFNALAEYMGDGVTVSALRHRIARLRAKAEEGHEVSSSVSPVAKKRQRTPKKSDKATARKAKDADAESSGEGGASKKPKIKHEETKDSILSSDYIKAEEDSSDI
ncbi:hypothetical protein ACN38_g10357 [Penicillium nordicum]|uniref:AT hook motif protein n=1 Tax=Penicillium nordicum TaxID=229535 RepID=A0A0M9WBQ9_9EURO|nr:hypothetical protein ACN38_g10357 [Penicillium nordicum]